MPALFSLTSLAEHHTTDHPMVILVFFLGGCSYAEISALRFLAQRDDGEPNAWKRSSRFVRMLGFEGSIFSAHALFSVILYSLKTVPVYKAENNGRKSENVADW